ncbi:peptidase C25 [Polaribacter pacificus]|uniref:Peptidase C25 n=1 Tax=Polaribacter pacificus TaxID=1775173 RepID=A0A917ME65_9FLAO|nr:type IX secretion system sortase PorU [Polaribacter pacificus]GGH01595.1 peptidase C25 [Polaribacter pacificus]
MKRYLLLLLIFVFSIVSANAQTTSVLSNGDWYQFSIDTTGVFKLDKEFLTKLGINTSTLDPKNIRVFGNGGAMLPEKISDFRYDDLQETAIYVEGETDGVFHETDYVLFYGVGAHSWSVNPSLQKATHKQNLYEDKAYYYITVTEGVGKRINEATEITDPAIKNISIFDDFVFHEKETRNLFAIGTQWFGEDFSVQNTQSFSIPFDKAVANSPISISVRGAAISSLASSMNITVNATNQFIIPFQTVNAGSLTLGYTTQRNTTINNSNNVIDVIIDYNNGGNPAAKAYLDFIEIVGKKRLIAGSKQFSFRSFDAFNTNGVVQYVIADAEKVRQIWDVSNPLQPFAITDNTTDVNYGFKALGGSLKEYVALVDTDYYSPSALDNPKVSNQNLHALKDINYLLITNNELESQAQRLADFHSTNSGLKTKVVLLDEIYHEFSSGSKDLTAIRDFIKNIYDSNSSSATKLQYVCFFGDGSYDYKDRIGNNTNIVPVYQSFESFNLATSYVTDDYFGMLDADEGGMQTSHTLDVATGRIPVSTVQQAAEVVTKILSYYNTSSFGDWRNTITLLADDTDEAGEDYIQSGVERIADSIKKNRGIFNVNKIYADAYKQENSSGGERYPQVNTAITNAIEKGTLVFDYFGHGGEDGFASERILDVPQIQNLNNPKTLPLFITVTCEFSRFDNPLRTTAGELIFWNSNGGAASLITTTREVFISVGQNFNERLLNILLQYDNQQVSIAESLRLAKNGFTNFQKYFIYYLGDPAMHLAIPKPNVVLTKMNGVAISQSIDTLKALSKVRFEGIVTDQTNQPLTSFNGTLSTTVYDKSIDKTTLDNNGFGVKMTFDSQSSKLFKGKATVQNGAFSFDFIVPKDIKVAYGKGKLSFYAENGVEDKAGANFEVVVGGVNPNAIDDEDGPQLKVFMNDESFVDGGTTTTSPSLIIHLSDPSGINTSITAIDHDIIAIVDGDQANPIVLNDFYETELNDFTQGKVVYQLRDLSAGAHSIKIKAWDTYNNSSETSLNFVSVSQSGLTLEKVLNYPNPFVSFTEFWFEHNMPNEPLEVQVQIMTISGKLIKTINQTVQTSSNLSRSITWNGLDDFGNKIGKGVYIYKLKVRSTRSNQSAEKYEKLVIL